MLLKMRGDQKQRTSGIHSRLGKTDALKPRAVGVPLLPLCPDTEEKNHPDAKCRIRTFHAGNIRLSPEGCNGAAYVRSMSSSLFHRA